MGVWTANVAVGAAVLLAGIALLLAVVAFVSYSRLRHGRLAWVGVAFLGFCAEGVALAWWTYGKRSDIAAGLSQELLVLSLLNLAIVVALYLAVLKR